MKLLIKIVLVLITTSAFAQTGNVYSRYGIGDELSSFSGRIFALGGASLALDDSENLASSNPAALHNLNLTRFEAGVAFQQAFQEQNGLNSQSFDNRFMGIKLGFPIHKELGIAFALYIEPVASVNYDVRHTFSFEDEDVTERYAGEGGISKIGMGISYRLPFGFSLGSSFDYYSGETKYISEIIFPIASAYNDSYHEKRYQQRAIGYSLGILSNNLSEYFGISAINDFKIGATFRQIPKMIVDTSLVLKSDFEEVTNEAATVYSEIPNQIAFGMKMDISRKFLILADLSTTPWSKYSFNDRKMPNFVDDVKYNFGVEYLDRNPRSKTFLEEVTYRLGFEYKKLNYTIEDTQLHQYAWSLGFGIPISNDDNLDFGVQYGFRGNPENDNIVQEKFIKFALSLSFGEQWFLRKD